MKPLYRKNRPVTPDASVEVTIELIQGKWKGRVLQQLLQNGPQRFNDLVRMNPQITQRMLSKQLRDLVNAGLVLRTAYLEVPVRVEYRMTPLGASLAPILRALHQWGKNYGTRKISAHPKRSGPISRSSRPTRVPARYSANS